VETTLGVTDLLELIEIALALSALSLASIIFFLDRYSKAQEAGVRLLRAVTIIGFLFSSGAGMVSILATATYFQDFLTALGMEWGLSRYFSHHGLLYVAIALLSIPIMCWSWGAFLGTVVFPRRQDR
jgi:hypothetical protein